MKLSNKSVMHKRQIVTLLDLLGNIGGFNDAIWLLVSFFMGTYSSLMFMRSVTESTPISSAHSTSHIKSKS